MPWEKSPLIFLNHSKQEAFIDYFGDEWGMLPFAVNYFNKLINESKELTEAMKNDLTMDFVKQLHYSVKKTSNQIIQINAEPNEGKSVLAQAIAIALQKLQWLVNKVRVKIYYTFDYSQTIIKIKEMNDGDIVIQDEVSSMEGTDSRAVILKLNNLLKTIRQTQKSVIFCTPKRVQFSATNVILEPIGKGLDYDEDLENYDDMLTRALVKYPRNGIDNTIGYIIVHIGEAITSPAHQGYLEAKRANIDKMVDASGTTVVTVDTEQRDEDVQRLYAIAMENNWDGKKTNLKMYYDAAHIAANTEGKKIIFSMCQKLYKTGNNTKKTLNKILKDGFVDICIEEGIIQLIDIEVKLKKMYPEIGFTTSMMQSIKKDILKAIEKVKKSIKPEDLKFDLKNVKEDYEFSEFVEEQASKLALPNNEKIVLVSLAQGLSVKSIVDMQLPSPSSRSGVLKGEPIRDIKKKAETTSLALWSEQYIAALLKHDISECAGNGSHKPDLIHNGIPWSIKSHYIKHGTKTFDIQKECSPEYDYMVENDIDHLIVCLISPKWMSMPKVVRVARTQSVVSFSKKSVSIMDFIDKGDEILI